MAKKKLSLRLEKIKLKPAIIRLAQKIKLRDNAKKDYLREYLQRQSKSAGS